MAGDSLDPQHGCIAQQHGMQVGPSEAVAQENVHHSLRCSRPENYVSEMRWTAHVLSKNSQCNEGMCGQRQDA